MARLILLTDFSEEYAAQLLKGIAEYSKAHTPWVLCKMPLSYRDLHGIKGVVEWAVKWKADAIIGQFYPKEEVELFAANGIIAVAQDFKTRFAQIPNITGDHFLSGEMGARYFIKKGFRNFAFYGFRDVVWSQERAEGFRSELQKAGLEENFREYNNVDFTDLWYYESEPLTEWLQSLPRPVAMMTCDDNQGHHIAELCKNCGIRIPQDIALLGVDNDTTVCSLSDPPLSSINQAVEKAGYQTAAMIDAMMEERDNRGYDILVIPTHIITRNSTDIYATSDKYISVVLQYIHNNIDKRLTVAAISKLVPLSRRLLENKFKQATGFAVYNYIFNLRISKFAEMLLDSDAPIIEIAMDMGFSDYKNISRQFRKVKGCSPSEYRLRRKIKISGIA